MKDLSKIIREFEKFEKLPYEKKKPKHEPTGSYYYLNTRRSRVVKVLYIHISSKFDSPEKMKFKSSQSKVNWKDQERG